MNKLERATIELQTVEHDMRVRNLRARGMREKLSVRREVYMVMHMHGWHEFRGFRAYGEYEGT